MNSSTTDLVNLRSGTIRTDRRIWRWFRVVWEQSGSIFYFRFLTAPFFDSQSTRQLVGQPRSLLIYLSRTTISAGRAFRLERPSLAKMDREAEYFFQCSRNSLERKTHSKLMSLISRNVFGRRETKSSWSMVRRPGASSGCRRDRRWSPVLLRDGRCLPAWLCMTGDQRPGHFQTVAPHSCGRERRSGFRFACPAIRTVIRKRRRLLHDCLSGSIKTTRRWVRARTCIQSQCAGDFPSDLHSMSRPPGGDMRHILAYGRVIVSR